MWVECGSVAPSAVATTILEGFPTGSFPERPPTRNEQADTGCTLDNPPCQDKSSR